MQALQQQRTKQYLRRHRGSADLGVRRIEPGAQIVQDRINRLFDRTQRVIGADAIFDIEQFLYGEDITQVVEQGTDVVHAVGEGQPLVVGLGLCELLEPAVQMPQVRYGAHHDLTVQLQHHPQHAVGGGMLGAHVDDHVSGLGHVALPKRDIPATGSRRRRGTRD